MSLCLLYQQLAQCKAIYDKHAATILGNMDSVVFLGGREASTIKEISENWLGKATISMQTDLSLIHISFLHQTEKSEAYCCFH